MKQRIKEFFKSLFNPFYSTRKEMSERLIQGMEAMDKAFEECDKKIEEYKQRKGK